MRLAAIDIGTNSVHMIVVRVRPDFSFEVIDREKEMVRLGAGGLGGRKLTREAMNAALQALGKFERLAKSHQVDQILAAATSATREAENGGDLLAAIEHQTGIRPRSLQYCINDARHTPIGSVFPVFTAINHACRTFSNSESIPATTCMSLACNANSFDASQPRKYSA